jgi:alpha-galactosidase
MNRDLTAPGGADGRASVDRQTRALFALLDALRARHPTVEIESCASGGGRADLAILQRTDRVWTSDTNDAIERLAITRGFSLVFPPEVTGAHIGPVRAHTTGRHLSYEFQAAVSMFGHLGLELDVTALEDGERETLRRWIARYKTHRALLHDGWTRMLPADDPGLDARAVIARDGREALVLAARVATISATVPPPLRVTGLAPDKFFIVRVVELAGSVDAMRGSTPFLEGEAVTLSGAFLSAVGIQIPGLSPGSAALYHLLRVDAPA